MSRNGKARLALVILAAALILSLGLAVSVGSMAIPMGDVYRVMASSSLAWETAVNGAAEGSTMWCGSSACPGWYWRRPPGLA